MIDVNRVHWGDDECKSVLEDEETNIFTLASGNFVRSEAPYPGSGQHACPASSNGGYEPDDEVYEFKGACTVVVSCFAGSETVVRLEPENGEKGVSVPISEIGVGDYVLTLRYGKGGGAGDLLFSQVIAVPHLKNAELVKFMR